MSNQAISVMLYRCDVLANPTAEDSSPLRCSAVAIGKTALLRLCDPQDGGFTMLKSNYLPADTA
jgi:hypothetical protein